MSLTVVLTVVMSGEWLNRDAEDCVTYEVKNPLFVGSAIHGQFRVNGEGPFTEVQGVFPLKHMVSFGK